ncbi:MAG: hypothetical protein HY058_00895 [Proteobacteria bacterium]|nr:hypothetical protein [Pseudomonadota bacterium]
MGGFAVILIAILFIGGLVVLPVLARGFGGGQAHAPGHPTGAPPAFGPLAFLPTATEPRRLTQGPGLSARRPAARALGMAPPPPPPPEPDDMVDALIDVRRVEGRIKAASLKKFAELLERHPEAVGEAMRRWLNDGSGNR